MGSGLGKARRAQSTRPGTPTPVTLAAKPLVVLSRVRNKATGIEGKVISGLVKSTGEIEYGVVCDSGYEDELVAHDEIELVKQPELGEDDLRMMQKLDILGEIVYLRKGAGRDVFQEHRRGVMKQSAQVVAVRPQTTDTPLHPVTSSDLRVSLLFYMDGPVPLAGFHLDEIIRGSPPLAERVEVDRVEF